MRDRAFNAEQSESVEVDHSRPHEATDFERALDAAQTLEPLDPELLRWADDGGPCT